MNFPYRHLGASCIVACVLIAGGGRAAWAQERLDIVHEESHIVFESRQMGVRVRGSFESWEADIRLDEDTPENSRASIVVQVDSIRTGHRDSDAEVRRRSWLNVEQFPEAVFESESVRQVEEGSFEAIGTLRIRDHEESVVVPFVLVSDGDGVREMRGSFIIKRATFGVGGGMWADFDVVANEVLVEFLLRARD